MYVCECVCVCAVASAQHTQHAHYKHYARRVCVCAVLPIGIIYSSVGTVFVLSYYTVCEFICNFQHIVVDTYSRRAPSASFQQRLSNISGWRTHWHAHMSTHTYAGYSGRRTTRAAE